MERVWREAAAVVARGPVGRGPDHPRHARRSWRETSIEADERSAYARSASVDQIYGPQTLLAQLAPVPAGGHARAARAPGSTGCAAYGPFMDANIEILHDGLALGPDGGADRRRADDRPARAAPGDADRAGGRPGDVKVAARRGPRAGPGRRARRRLPGRPAATSRRFGRVPTRRRASSPGSCRRPTARRSTATRSGAGRRSTWTREDVHQVGLEELGDDRRRAAGDRARAGASATTSTRTARRSSPTPPTSRATPEELVARANEDIVRAGRGRAAGVRTPARGRAAIVRPVEPFKEKDAPFAYYFPPTIDGSRPGIYYVNTYDLPSRTLLQARVDDVPRGDPRAPLPDRASRWSTRRSTCSGGSARGCVGGAYVEGWGLYAERLADELGLYRNERGAVRDARRAGVARVAAHRRLRDARPGLVAPAVDRLAARRPACRRPTRRSRPTATSRGPARP